MSQIDTGENILSEAKAGQDDVDNSKLVPVAESIRYRKRAQSAEKKVETLSEELAQAKSQISGMAEELGNLTVEQELIRKLVSAGTVDLEAAVLIAKARSEGQTDSDLDGVIEQLKKEKQYLFGKYKDVTVTAGKTAGAKDRVTGNQAILEGAAKKAAATGNRTALQEYLKLRRSFV
jgi:archaellum component FlaC